MDFSVLTQKVPCTEVFFQKWKSAGPSWMPTWKELSLNFDFWFYVCILHSFKTPHLWNSLSSKDWAQLHHPPSCLWSLGKRLVSQNITGPVRQLDDSRILWEGQAVATSLAPLQPGAAAALCWTFQNVSETKHEGGPISIANRWWNMVKRLDSTVGVLYSNRSDTWVQ